jgi:hypothetical protein
MYPQRKKSSEVKSEERGVQVIGPQRPVHLLPKVSSKYLQMTLVQCAGVPSCWNHISQRASKAGNWIFSIALIFQAAL